MPYNFKTQAVKTYSSSVPCNCSADGGIGRAIPRFLALPPVVMVTTVVREAPQSVKNEATVGREDVCKVSSNRVQCPTVARRPARHPPRRTAVGEEQPKVTAMSTSIVIPRLPDVLADCVAHTMEMGPLGYMCTWPVSSVVIALVVMSTGSSKDIGAESSVEMFRQTETRTCRRWGLDSRITGVGNGRETCGAPRRSLTAARLTAPSS